MNVRKILHGLSNKVKIAIVALNILYARVDVVDMFEVIDTWQVSIRTERCVYDDILLIKALVETVLNRRWYVNIINNASIYESSIAPILRLENSWDRRAAYNSS